MSRGRIFIFCGVALLVVAVFAFYFLVVQEKEGKNFCELDNDCINTNGWNAGCWNKNYIPEPGFFTVVPTLAGPEFCICEENVCMSASVKVKQIAALEGSDAAMVFCLENTNSEEFCEYEINEALRSEENE